MAAGGKQAQQQQQSQLTSQDLRGLAREQLEQLHGELENEGKQLDEAVQQLQQAVQRFHKSGLALEGLKEHADGKRMLVPLTGSMYVEGEVGEGGNERVLVDVGTGYYIEQSPDQGAEYCKRKVTSLKENLDRLAKQLQEKRNQVGQVERELQRRSRSSPPSAS